MKCTEIVGYFKFDAAERIAVDVNTGEGAPAYSMVTLPLLQEVELTQEQHDASIERLKLQLLKATGINPDHVSQVTKEEYEANAEALDE